MKTSEVLQKARDLLTDREHWAQEWFAYNKNGVYADATDKDATCWCSIGAICKVEGIINHNKSNAFLRLNEVLKVHFNWWSGVADYNDTHTHGEVLALFDKAIELTKAEEV